MSAAVFSANLLIPADKLSWYEKIGEGGCGEVFRVVHEDWGQLAVKKLSTQMIIQNEKVVVSLHKEAEILSDLRHTNVVQFFGVVWEPLSEPPHFGIAMPLAPHGSLASFIKEETVPWPAKLNFGFQAACGMLYLTTLPKPVLHGDLKLGNILLEEGLVVKVSDFGLSQWRAFQTSVSNSKFDTSQKVSGTITHIAPESLESSKLTQERDVYAFAILLWELFTQEMPFAGLQPMQIMFTVMRGKRPDKELLPGDIPESIKSIITNCWDQDPNERPTFASVKQMLEDICQEEDFSIADSRMDLLSSIHRKATIKKLIARGKDPSTFVGTKSTKVAELVAELSINRSAADTASVSDDLAAIMTSPDAAPDSAAVHDSYAALDCDAACDSVSAPDAATNPDEQSGDTVEDDLDKFEDYVDFKKPIRDSITVAYERGNRLATGDSEAHGSLKPVALTKCGCLRWNDGRGKYFVCLGYNEEVVMYDSEGHLMMYFFAGTEYRFIHTAPKPKSLSWWSKKQMSQHGTLFLQEHVGEITQRYNKEMETTGSVKHPGELIACLHPEKLVYCQIQKKVFGVDKWRLVIYDSNKKINLDPPKNQTLNQDLSVCADENIIASVNSVDQSLDVFSKNGKHIHHCELPYKPHVANAVTVVDSGLLIIAVFASPPTLHVHRLSGEHVQELQHEDLEEDLAADERVHAIKYSNDGTLHLVSGKSASSLSVHAYRMCIFMT